MRRAARIGTCLAALAIATACQSPQPIVSAQVMSEVDLASLQGFYVPIHQDDRGIGGFITNDLRRRGKQVQTGTAPTPPEGTQVLVVYDDSWFWEWRVYLLLLRIEFRDPETHLLLATGASSRPSAVRAPPATMVWEVLDAIFRGGAVAFPNLVLEEDE